ncbi:hypothetical protein Q787_07215 [Ornithobacterium rhinotracheale H06-030791]|uniref:Uncharacterized protein n=1 Tax=Ornithobacterium rhinotracheale (strain ATCC 51463 / DSM 15997 / CCUG 23171 / CIP 104009 / LMG 9086) TaxID=867902 RepID=I3ZYA6_ORNRL|nr:hypothetical protein Ornrh_0483 [Ornithobacterium rhinotracheale DSM 15997]AIQ00580.1 hypothetical protein Q785_07315 [Ornithobacterium rhinotracheale ORT-UMN 88]KGB66747.1 hypothetical protein Q787_07215 [Ornithobacterium rhinotracheale H06-030791]
MKILVDLSKNLGNVPKFFDENVKIFKYLKK